MTRRYTIAPGAIRTQDFGSKLRGYDPAQVRSFLEEIADQMDAVLNEATMLREKLARAQREAGELRKLDDATLPPGGAAPKAADDTRRAAEAEATDIIARAHVAAESAVAESQERLFQLHREINELTTLKSRIIGQIETLLNSQLDHLELLKGNDTPVVPEDAPEAPPVLAEVLDDERVA
ncbi:MAG: DivIVA domain-containing protein [Candidatus Zixiibacteriota bacterium]